MFKNLDAKIKQNEVNRAKRVLKRAKIAQIHGKSWQIVVK